MPLRQVWKNTWLWWNIFHLQICKCLPNVSKTHDANWGKEVLLKKGKKKKGEKKKVKSNPPHLFQSKFVHFHPQNYYFFIISPFLLTTSTVSQDTLHTKILNI